MAADPPGRACASPACLRLGHNYSVDLYVESVLARARLIVVRLLGGSGYWRYGVERVADLARERGIALALLPGDDQPDAELARLSTLPAEAAHRLWRYLVEGGAGNAEQFLRYAASLIGGDRGVARAGAAAARRALLAGTRRRRRSPRCARHGAATAPVAAIVFYRALVQAANTAPVDALIAALQARGLNPLPLFASEPQGSAVGGDPRPGCWPRRRPTSC